MQYESPCPLHDGRRRREAARRLALAAALLSALVLASAIAVYATTTNPPRFAPSNATPITASEPATADHPIAP